MDINEIENYQASESEILLLEKSYQEASIWEENQDQLEKARQAAPVGTIKRIGNVEYIKTPDGWRYHTKGQRKKAQDHYSKEGGAIPAHLNGDISEYRKNNGGHTSFKIKEGDSITSKDGTQGQVVSHDGQQATVKFSTKDGEEKTVKVDAQKLEHNLASGNLKHNPSKENAAQGDDDQHEDNDTNIVAQAETEDSPKQDDAKEDQPKTEEKKEAPKTEEKKQDSPKKEGEDNSSKKHPLEDHSDVMNASFLSSDEKLKIIEMRKLMAKERADKEQRDAADKKSEEKPKEQVKKPEEKKEEKSPEEIAKESNLNVESVQDAKVLGEGKDGPAKLNEEKEGFSVKQDTVITDDKKSGEKGENGESNEINKKFEAFGRFARGVINGRMKSMIAYGSGGVGKTYTVTQELQKAGKKIFDPEIHQPGDEDYDYVKITGKMTAAAVYENMYKHNGKILMFDDCDSVLQDPNAINLFKGALDTSGDGSIDWGSKSKIKDNDGNPLPEKFAFKGRAMFISNLDVNGKDGKAIQPIVSRGYSIDLTMNPQQTMDRIEHIATSKDGKMTNLKFPGIEGYTHEDMADVLSYMRQHADKAADLNVRTVGAILGIKLEAEADGVKDWTSEADYHYLRKSESIDIFNGGLQQLQKARLSQTYDNVEKSKFSNEIVDHFKKSMKDKIESKEHYTD